MDKTSCLERAGKTFHENLNEIQEHTLLCTISVYADKKILKNNNFKHAILTTVMDELRRCDVVD